MINKKIFLFLLLVLSPFSVGAQNSVQPSQAERLKQTMIQFQLLVSKMQMLQSQNPISWNLVNQQLQSINNNIQVMQNFDSQGNYGAYLQKISSIVNEMKQLAAQKNPALFEKMPSLTQSCFQCHQTHGARGIEDYKH